MIRALVIATMVGGLVLWSPAFALSCKRHDAATLAKINYQTSQAVFIGQLVRIDLDEFDPWAERDRTSEMETIMMPGQGPLHRGTFVVSEAFKGEIGREIVVGVPSDASIGAKYIVFAERVGLALVSLAACRTTQIPLDRDDGFHLGWLAEMRHASLALLRSLPPPDSGSNVTVTMDQSRLMNADSKHEAVDEWRTRIVLRFVGRDPGHIFEAPFVEDGDRMREHVARGVLRDVYRLETPAPKGFTYTCNGGNACDAIEIDGRGEDRIYVYRVPRPDPRSR